MSPGTFLSDLNFKFHDGKIGNKIFVVFNNAASGIYIAAKTTSRPDRYGIQHGCQIFDRFPNYYFVHGSCFLNKNTWVQLNNFYEFKKDELMQKVISGQINRIGLLDENHTSDLITCASHSDDLSMSQCEMLLIKSK